MGLTDIASIVFVCVTANHLGLINAIEGAIGHEIPILNCPKCLSFWATTVYCIIHQRLTLCELRPHMILAISFLASYTAIWLELAEGYMDTLYMKLYEKISNTGDDNAPASDADEGDCTGPMPEVREEEE